MVQSVLPNRIPCNTCIIFLPDNRKPMFIKSNGNVINKEISIKSFDFTLSSQSLLIMPEHYEKIPNLSLAP